MTEGAFLLCGLLMALAWARQGDNVRAARWFQRPRAACGPPGLVSEEFDVQQRQLRGNLPQAPVHAALLQCAVTQPRGEGPCVDAWTNAEPVLEPDLASPQVARWPAFAPGARAAGVLAVFAFPLHLVAILIGVLVLYRDQPNGLNDDELAYGRVLADLATWTIHGLQSGAPADALHELLRAERPHWAEVHQATGMVSVQLGVGLDGAFVRMRGHAFAEGRPMREVVAHRLRLEASA